MSIQFSITKKDEKTKARLGVLKTAHGNVPTPLFMPVGTRAVVKTLTNQELIDIGVEMFISNTYHLLLRPGLEIMQQAGGLHAFMNWKRPLVTDSGGFQVFSLQSLTSVTDEGVHFQSHIDGAKLFLGPHESMAMQKAMGADIVTCFDACTMPFSNHDEKRESVRRTLEWAKLCKKYPLHPHQSLFAIIQGDEEEALRRECAKGLVAMDFAGYAIGGLSAREQDVAINQVIDATEPYMPPEKVRYLMGIGTPLNIIEAVMRGMDLFDCVLPTRAARGGTAYTWQGKIQIKSGHFANDFSPLDPELDSYASKFSKAYIRHLFNVDEITALTLVSMQNLAFYGDFMKKLRQSIQENALTSFYDKIASLYPV